MEIGKEVRIFLKGYRDQLDCGSQREDLYIELDTLENVNEDGIQLGSDGFHTFYPWNSIDHIDWDDGT